MLRPLVVTSLLLISATPPGSHTSPCPVAPTARSPVLIQTTCDDLRTALKRVPGASVRLGRTVFLDERFDCSRQGCVVWMKGSFKKLKDQASPDSWLVDFLEQRGWSRTSS